MKTMKPTLGPYECNHCHRVWYGICHTGNWVPEGRTLCSKCWSALDDYYFAHFRSRYNASWYFMKPEDIPFIHAEGNKWIDNNTLPPLRPKNIYYGGGVSQWMRSAIDTGLVKTNSLDVYVVTVDESGQAISVETSQDRGLLKKQRKAGW